MMSRAEPAGRVRSDVEIRPLTLDCAGPMFRWMCDPVVTENIGLRSEPTPERTRAWIENALNDHSIRPFAIWHNHEYVGNVVLDRIDEFLSSARLSVYIGEACSRGAGVGTAAVDQALLFGFRELHLHKIWLTVHERNFAGIRSYTKLGFSLEGILRDEFIIKGERLAAFYMGLLRSDFDRLHEQTQTSGA
jgi:RimJ/RimL family protein N-acetyltransferase